MARKLGPLHEFEDILNEGFNAAVDALMDDVAWNDEMDLDLLSMILSSLDGLEREAQIALSALISSPKKRLPLLRMKEAGHPPPRVKVKRKMRTKTPCRRMRETSQDTLVIATARVAK